MSQSARLSGMGLATFSMARRVARPGDEPQKGDTQQMRINTNRKLAAGILLALSASPALASSNGLFEPYADQKALSNDRALEALQRNPTTESLAVVGVNSSKVHKNADFVELNLGKGLVFNAYKLNSYESNGMTVW